MLSRAPPVDDLHRRGNPALARHLGVDHCAPPHAAVGKKDKEPCRVSPTYGHQSESDAEPVRPDRSAVLRSPVV
jgi:hypothetical protein